jgi:hypothetical protein
MPHGSLHSQTDIIAYCAERLTYLGRLPSIGDQRCKSSKQVHRYTPTALRLLSVSRTGVGKTAAPYPTTSRSQIRLFCPQGLFVNVPTTQSITLSTPTASTTALGPHRSLSTRHIRISQNTNSHRARGLSAMACSVVGGCRCYVHRSATA